MGGKKNNKILLSITNAKQSKENNQYQCFYHGKAAMSKENEKNTRRFLTTKNEKGKRREIHNKWLFQISKIGIFFL